MLRGASSSCSSGGTSHITSNSMPSGSWQYRLRLTPWLFSPTSAPISDSRALASANSASVATSQAR